MTKKLEQAYHSLVLLISISASRCYDHGREQILRLFSLYRYFAFMLLLLYPYSAFAACSLPQGSPKDCVPYTLTLTAKAEIVGSKAPVSFIIAENRDCQ